MPSLKLHLFGKFKIFTSVPTKTVSNDFNKTETGTASTAIIPREGRKHNCNQGNCERRKDNVIGVTVSKDFPSNWIYSHHRTLSVRSCFACEGHASLVIRMVSPLSAIYLSDSS